MYKTGKDSIYRNLVKRFTYPFLLGLFLTSLIILIDKITLARVNVIMLARIIGKLFNIKPYTNHKNTPNTKTTYINNDNDSVSLVFITLTACGKNEIDVNIAAVNPMISVKLIVPPKCFLQHG